MANMVSGYAMIEDGRILVDTVSMTRRAAIVNWLCVHRNIMIYNSYTDREIENQFTFQCRGHNPTTGKCIDPRVVVVMITETET